jgi:hypothetical protein
MHPKRKFFLTLPRTHALKFFSVWSGNPVSQGGTSSEQAKICLSPDPTDSLIGECYGRLA